MGAGGFSSLWVAGLLALVACAPKSAFDEDSEGPASGGAGESTGGSATGGNATGGNATGGNAARNGGEKTGGQAGADGIPATGGSGPGGSGGGGAAGLAGAAGCAPRAIQTCETNSERCPRGRAEATTCSSASSSGGLSGGQDECGCADAGTCPSGQLCLAIHYPAMVGIGGPGVTVNECIAASCAGDDDCPNGQRCTPGPYYSVCSAACRFDQECVAECGGQCVAPWQEYHAGSRVYDYSHARCLYPGSCSASTCSNCITGNLGGFGGADGHECRAPGGAGGAGAGGAGAGS